MKSDGRGRKFLLGLALFYALVFGGRAAWRSWLGGVRLSAAKSEFLHDEIVPLELRVRDPRLLARWKTQPPRAAVKFLGRRVPTIGGLIEAPLRFEEGSGFFKGGWPCPWNAPEGEYSLELSGGEDLGSRVKAGKFRIGRRRPIPIPEGYAVLTWESAAPFRGMTVRSPDGTVKDWKGLLDWVEYAGADAFWILAGETPGAGASEVWVSTNFAVIPEMGRECRRRGLQFGVYAKAYLTASPTRRLSRYEYAVEVSEGVPETTRAISLRDEARVRDVAALLKRFAAIPEVDFVGLDYIRNAMGGCELAEDFYAEMPGVSPPADWSRLSPSEKMVYFARKKGMRRDRPFIDAWQWWRAHTVGRIVRRIKAEVGSKPLWAFSLTWDKGWHHGQDPVMMNDAGIDIDALMMYEADEEQFRTILGDWRAYLRRGDAQLMVGDIVDWPLHQRDPSGPGALRRRVLQAAGRVFADGRAQGIFIHDLARALDGRLGKWDTRAWMDEARAAILEHKRRGGAG